MFLLRRRRMGEVGAEDRYKINGLQPVLVMDFESGTFKSNACGQYEINGLSPVLVMDFTNGEFYQKDCA